LAIRSWIARSGCWRWMESAGGRRQRSHVAPG
jgi:hypothetical protein